VARLSSEPPAGNYKRADDAKNKSLAPSVRFQNYCKAFMTTWPALIFILGLLGYTNKDHIAQWTGLSQPDGKTEVVATGSTFEQSVIANSQEVAIEIEKLKRELAAIRALIPNQNRPQNDKIDRLEKLHGL
jgi:hypothetical protein